MKGFRKVIFSVFVLVIALFSVAFADEPPAGQRMGVISGKVMIKGDGPMAKGMVLFYDEVSGPPPSATKYWRVPTLAFVTDNEGKFVAQVPEGKYCIGALKRMSGGQIGPPQAGDLFSLSQDENGKLRSYTAKKDVPVDAGVLEAAPFSAASVKEGITAIEGTVLDADGKPVEGILVFAFVTQSVTSRPLFVSDRTDKAGKYVLRVAEGGSYYLRLRQNYGGGPLREGEVKGTFGDSEPPSSVVVTKGETLRGINIKASRFEGRGPKGPVPGQK